MASAAIQTALARRQKRSCGDPPFAQEFAKRPRRGLYWYRFFGVTQPRQAFVDAGQGVGVLIGHLVQRAEVAAKAQLPVFLFYHYDATCPRGQRRLYHSQG